MPATRGLSAASLGVAGVVFVLTLGLLVTGRLSGGGSPVLTGVGIVACLIAASGVAFAVRGVVRSTRVSVQGGPQDHAVSRAIGADSREDSWRALSLALMVFLVALTLLLISANDAAIEQTFLQWKFMRLSLPDILAAFKINAIIAIGAEVLVLTFGLLLAVARLLPGSESRGLRFLAVAYIDVVRGIPAIVVLYLVGFGLPLTGLPYLADLPSAWYAILALAISYSAYVAEVYRAGVESVHPSQVAAARSLGLSHLQAMRYVVVPQAIRTVVAPLLTFFVGLQKDTALIGIIGTIDAFQQARIFSSNQFNLSSVTLVSAVFVLATVPQARLVDSLLARSNKKRR